jgi:hypothetical protein
MRVLTPPKPSVGVMFITVSIFGWRIIHPHMKVAVAALSPALHYVGFKIFASNFLMVMMLFRK